MLVAHCFLRYTSSSPSVPRHAPPDPNRIRAAGFAVLPTALRIVRGAIAGGRGGSLRAVSKPREANQGPILPHLLAAVPRRDRHGIFLCKLRGSRVPLRVRR